MAVLTRRQWQEQDRVRREAKRLHKRVSVPAAVPCAIPKVCIIAATFGHDTGDDRRKARRGKKKEAV